MGDRFILTVKCPECGLVDKEVYYAPTCGFTDWDCPKCNHKVDLEDYTGISYEDASNRDLIGGIVKDILDKEKIKKG
jgi:transposase-like protein